ncbi:MAG: peptide chain release factor 1, partial [Candidatus Altiarchaeota archaeon]|nr:peptide chain release factor 1 [Candidatus Altiarchaeota archaeon]
CRGRHTELISVYITPDYNLDNVIGQLFQEQGTASNIKGKTTKKNVVDALEKIIQHLRLYKGAPKNGLAIFCGNISQREGVQDIELWAIEPHEPITIRLYRCDQTFVTEPLEKILMPKHAYGLIAIDNKVATIGILKGDRYDILDKLTSGYSGKHRAGGQSHRRFERLIDEESHNFKKRIGEHANNLFMQNIKEITGFIIGGPAATKEDFIDGEYMSHEIKKKIVAVKDITYTDESGIRELVNDSKDVLKEVEASKHKEIMQRFMHSLVKNPGMVTYGKDEVDKALEMGSVDTLLISEKLDEGSIDKLVEKAEGIGAKVEIVSDEFEEGNQLWVAFGGMAALLRYNAG